MAFLTPVIFKYLSEKVKKTLDNVLILCYNSVYRVNKQAKYMSYPKERGVDTSIVSAMQLFFLYGYNPGSCTELLLRGDFVEAKSHAHMMIRDDGLWEDHMNFTKHLVPECCKNENYDSWKGYLELTPEEQEEVKVLLTLQGGAMLVKMWTTDPRADIEYK